MQFIALVIGSALAVLTLPIWGGALGVILGTGLYLLVNHFWILLAITVGVFALAAMA
jgi:hypothetical protein